MSRRRRWVLALVPLAAMAAGAWSQPASAANFTWTGGAGTTNADRNWGLSGNWDPAPTFNNQADIIFDQASVVNASSFSFIGAGRTIRSLTWNADFLAAGGTTYDIRLRADSSGAGRNLTFAANSGNASITVAESTTGITQIRLGDNVGNDRIFLNSNLDLAQNNTFLTLSPAFQFNESVSGTGIINKTGAGRVTFVRNNSSWSGGMNINEGTVDVWANNNNMGTGVWTLGGGANNTVFGVGSNATLANSGGLVVADGAGNRTISLISHTAGNPTLGGNITLNKDAIFSTDQYVFGTHDRITSTGVISGTGGIAKNGTGGLILAGTNTYSGATTVNGSGAGYVTILDDSGLGADPGSPTASHLVLNNGGLNTAGSFTLSANRGIELAGDGGLIFTNTGTELAYDGIMTGTNFIKNGTGVLTLGGANTYTGATTVSAGGLLVNGSQASTGLTSVANNARIGGTGSLTGGLSIASGGLFVFDPLAPLDVSGTVTLDNTFSVASLVNPDGSAISWGSVADSTYSLIGLTSSTFNTITNFGSGDPFDIGDGRTAYFTNTTESGGLSLVVVPEPSTFALLGGVAAVGVFMMRRRRTIG